jgi:hypothetical protein
MNHILLIQMYLGGHPPFSLNHHFEPVVLINHDIHSFDGEWNVMSSLLDHVVIDANGLID